MAVQSSEFSEFHAELRSVARELLAKDGEGAAVGWPALVDAGWTGLEIPAELGGAGATFAEVAIICEEIGRASADNGYLGGAVLAAGALKLLVPSETRDELLSAVAGGDQRVAVVLTGFGLNNGVLEGHAQFVPDADGADRLLVLASTADGSPVLVDATGLGVEAQPVLDKTRRMATVHAAGIAVEDTAVLHFTGDGSDAVQALHDRAAVAVACDSLGLAEAMLAATVSYVKVRHQFDRPIGSFQAVKHACADMMVAVAVTRQLVGAAVAAVAADPQSADSSVAAAMAKVQACGSAVDIAGKAMQLHGGIGYTWESGIHVYLKRAALNRSLFGSSAAHRQRLSRRYSST